MPLVVERLKSWLKILTKWLKWLKNVLAIERHN